MMRNLDYQARVLKTFNEYLEKLSSEKARSDKIAELSQQDPDLGITVPDFTSKAWDILKSGRKLPASRQEIPFSPRSDGMSRPVPNVVFKVPTGGGKTFLAVSALSQIFGRYLGRNSGFILWVVPNEAIYSQTRKQLVDRQHPYRQVLDRAAAGKVRLLEKTDSLDIRDIEENLCVMLLMLQSANRQTRETLKMFKDRGDIHGFFPPEGNQEEHRKILKGIPNLDPYSSGSHSSSFWPLVKDSLGNALRMIRPVVLMDEGHRAVSNLAYSNLYGFNPCFVLELTATPKDVIATTGKNPKPARYANILVEVSGLHLDREGMIKMPLNLDPRQGTDWRATLSSALERLNVLDREAKNLYADRGRYIRPIMLVQVERTGKDQRDGTYIHALDVRDWLKTAGLDDAEIAIKTADTNDLDDPENMDLLSPLNRVRVIITKQALQEGWDCPFAYVLCALAASSNITGMTQLVGRILRQPYAEKTGIQALDESYVITHHAKTTIVISAIKQGLEEDGLGDLVKEIRPSSPEENRGSRPIKRRDIFSNSQIYLPLVLVKEKGLVRSLDYDSDILFRLDWTGIDPMILAKKIPENVQPADSQMQRILLTDSGSDRISSETLDKSTEQLIFDPVYAVRMISDIIPNPWIAWDIIQRFESGLKARGFAQEDIGKIAGLLVEELRKWLDDKRTAMAEELFRSEVESGRIQFCLRLDGKNWRMPFETETFESEGSDQLLGKNGGPLEKSLFSPLYKNDFNQDERNVAVYLDGENTLKWWHRNVARSQYSIQGWRREKIYPDFIFGVRMQGDLTKIVVLETKGEHLEGNDDTEYKRKLLDLVSRSFSWNTNTPFGKVELFGSKGDMVVCDMILMDEWRTRLPKHLILED